MSKFVKGAAVALVSVGLMAGTVAIPQANAVSYVCKYEQKKSGQKGAAIGALGQDEPAWALALSVVVPALLWLGARRWMRR